MLQPNTAELVQGRARLIVAAAAAADETMHFQGEVACSATSGLRVFETTAVAAAVTVVPLCCWSSCSARLLAAEWGLKAPVVQQLQLHEPVVIDGVTVTALDANHW